MMTFFRRWPHLVSGILLGLVLWPPAAAHADAPFHDPDFVVPQGGGPTTTTAATGDPMQAAPPEAPVSMPIGVPLAQQDPGGDAGPGNPNDPQNWLNLRFNPGKWLMDSVLGAMAGLFYSFASIFESFADWATAESDDGDDAAPSGIAGDPRDTRNIMFQTPLDYTMHWRGNDADSALQPGNTRWVYTLFQQLAAAVLLVIVLYRLLRLLGSPGERGPRTIDLVWSVGCAVVGIGASWVVCEQLIISANTISQTVVNSYTFWDGSIFLPVATPDAEAADHLWLGRAFMVFLYWAMVAWILLISFERILLVNLMVMISPLAGLALATGGGWGFARSWFFQFLELISTPIIIAIVLGFARNLMGEFGVMRSSSDLQDQVVMHLLSMYALWIAHKAPAMVGLALRSGPDPAKAFYHGVRMSSLGGKALGL